MTSAYVAHIAAGGLGILSGFVALYTTKGAPVHRRAGMVFVYSMLTMAVAGGIIAAVKGVAPAVNIPSAVITAYLVVTAFTAIRPPSEGLQWTHTAGMMVALGIVVTEAWLVWATIAYGAQERGYLFPFIMFGSVAFLAFLGDLRILRHGRLRGPRRIARHLWRMSFALFVAALSFFIGQARVIPRPIRIMPLLALPVLLVLVTMIYWLWRVRVRRSLGGLRGASLAEAA